MFSKFMIFLGIPGFITGVAYFMDGNIFGPSWAFDMIVYFVTGQYSFSFGRTFHSGSQDD